MAFELKEEGFKLKDVLLVVGIPEATYHYHVKRLHKSDPNKKLKELIRELFAEHKERYGYRRIHQELRKRDAYKHINHKKVQKIMQALGLKCVKFTRKSRYNSYKGKVGKVAKNRLNRRFNTTIPLQKLVTDVTEFKCSDNQKLYLSPILDLYNGEIISYSTSPSPTLEFVLTPLHKAIKIINNKAPYRTTIHSDQGWHYQHKKWIKILKKNNIYQSMSRKATCADNASMENFFGIMKQEMYYGESFDSYNDLKEKIEEYIYYYNHERIKEKTAGLSPVEYRLQTSQAAA